MRKRDPRRLSTIRKKNNPSRIIKKTRVLVVFSRRLRSNKTRKRRTKKNSVEDLLFERRTLKKYVEKEAT